MTDTLATASRVSDPGLRNLYSQESRWQSWLDVEAALAKAQAELGIIPADAAQAIVRCAHLELLDRARIKEGYDRTAHTLVPLVWELGRVVGEKYGGWVHWGATTQNITTVGDLLILRKAHGIFRKTILDLLKSLAILAEQGKDMLMPGRTHGQHAVPITFGFKVAGWIDEILRHLERFEQASPRIFSVVNGGAAGTYASLGERGPALQEKLAEHLEMTSMAVPSRAIGDGLTENICLLGMLAATCSRMAREIYLLMKTDFSEVEEPVPEGTVGSSTMPQKRNPKLCQDIVGLAAEIRSIVPLALEAMQTEHEGDRTTTVMMDAAEGRACIATGDMLIRLATVMSGLKLNPVRMRSNLNHGGGLIMAEAVMLELGKLVGRQHAHDIVYVAAQTAFSEKLSFADLLCNDASVRKHLEPEQIHKLLEPKNYTGLCSSLAEEAVKRVQKYLD